MHPFHKLRLLQEGFLNVGPFPNPQPTPAEALQSSRPLSPVTPRYWQLKDIGIHQGKLGCQSTYKLQRLENLLDIFGTQTGGVIALHWVSRIPPQPEGGTSHSVLTFSNSYHITPSPGMMATPWSLSHRLETIVHNVPLWSIGVHEIIKFSWPF